MFLKSLVAKAARCCFFLSVALGVATLAAGAAQAQSVVVNTATVTAPDGVVDNDPDNNTDTAEVTVLAAAPEVTVFKASDPASGESVRVNDTITYTLTVEVAEATLLSDVVLTDTLGAGLAFGSVVEAGDFTCIGELSCTLSAGTAPGTYDVVYTATVTADAQTSVANSVQAAGGGDPDDPDVPQPDCVSCATDHPVDKPEVTYSKSADPASGTSVIVGAVISYTLGVTVTNADTLSDVVLTDTVGAGLGEITVTSQTPFTGGFAGNTGTFTLPAGTAPGTYELTYTATVQGDAGASVGNAVEAVGGGDPADPANPQPDCATSCTTDHPVSKPEVTYSKSADPASGTDVTVGQVITYTLGVTVTEAAMLSDVVLTDTVGAGLGEIDNLVPGAFTGGFAGNTGTFTLPSGAEPGTYEVTYTATVQGDAGASVGNAVAATGGGDPGDPDAGDPTCSADCDTGHPVNRPEVTYSKSADPASGTDVTVGQEITYTLTVEVTDAALLSDVVLTDTVGAGLGEIDNLVPGAFTGGFAGNTGTFTLPSGTAPGTYEVTYTATVQGDAGASVGNAVAATGGGDPGDPGAGDPTCSTDCETEHPVNRPEVTYSKSADPASGTDVTVGQEITYTLSVTVSEAATLSAVVLTDTVGAGLGEITVTSQAPFTGDFTGNVGAFTLASGTVPGIYEVIYTATVQGDAGATVGNAVEAAGGGDPEDPANPQPDCETSCQTDHNVNKPEVTVTKASDPASGSAVQVNDTITYTLTVEVANAATLSDVVLTDTLDTGLELGTVTAPDFSCNDASPLVCALPQDTAPGSYQVSYTATVAANATTSVSNSVEASGGNDPGDPNNPQPDCTNCETDHPVERPAVTVSKSSNPDSGTEVRAGELIEYTLTVTVDNAPTLDELVLVDTLGAGLDFGEVTDPGAFACADELSCTLPAGTAPGSYVLVYTATVNDSATGSVGNVVTAGGGTGDSGTPPECAPCSTDHPVADPRVFIAKSADPADGEQVSVGDTIEYTLAVTVENSVTLADLRLTDTPGPGLAIGALPDGCTAGDGNVVCVLPAGTAPGIYTFVYPATVTADASGTVDNVVVGEYLGDGGSGGEPECTVCQTSHELLDESDLRIVKTVAVRNVNIGDLVRYTLTVENIGTVHVVNGRIIDTPPAGFSYVDGSLAIVDGDNAATVTGYNPIRIDGVDILAGGQATITYLMRVGAGVRNGTHVNEAVAVDNNGIPVSNVATAQVMLDGDPLLEDSLIFGTVFDDRDGDGWQDPAHLSGVGVQGGFAASAYVPGSTTIDRGAGPQPVADASAPLLRGLEIGVIAGRQSAADPVEHHQVTVRQRLTSLDFGNDFVLTSDQGVTVRLDAQGNATTGLSGEAAKGLTAAAPTVERRVSTVEGGYELAYVISNTGIDERGIPGVRIASVEGLLIETDQYGRYHLADVHGGDWGRGRNFILKVDPATLPPGTVFTTDNPRVRRVTPGIPVRFDFGVQLPVEEIPGGTEQVELELGEVIFAPGSAQVRERYLPAIEAMAGQVHAYGGGEVVITADGGGEALAFARAEAVRAALLERVDGEAAAGLTVTLRTRAAGLVAGVDGAGTLLGTVLFDTDGSQIRPEYQALLDRVAERLETMGGGVVGIVGHTDVRASHAYNVALGMRRAQTVFDALAQRLSPEVRSRLRVESSNDPTAPVGPEGK